MTQMYAPNRGIPMAVCDPFPTRTINIRKFGLFELWGHVVRLLFCFECLIGWNQLGVCYILKDVYLLMQLPRLPIGECILDLVVIGCGPAGLALAAESAKLGLNVGLIGPDLPFTNNYGVWEDEFIGMKRYVST